MITGADQHLYGEDLVRSHNRTCRMGATFVDQDQICTLTFETKP